MDIAYVDHERFWPIEIKWTNQLRPSDLKQISKYENACVYSKSDSSYRINGIEAIPLPLALMRLNHHGDYGRAAVSTD